MCYLNFRKRALVNNYSDVPSTKDEDCTDNVYQSFSFLVTQIGQIKYME